MHAEDASGFQPIVFLGDRFRRGGFASPMGSSRNSRAEAWGYSSINMKRVAFKMKLKSGFEEEYKKRHAKIWPELGEELFRAGISDYSIFFDRESHTLFAVQKLKDDHTIDELPSKEIMRRWWNYMKDIMETNPDNSPVTVSMDEVFHMD